MSAVKISIAEFRRIMAVGVVATLAIHSDLEKAELEAAEYTSEERRVEKQTPREMTVWDTERGCRSYLGYLPGSEAWRISDKQVVIRLGRPDKYSTYLCYYLK